MYALHINIIVCLSAWCNSRLHYKQCQVTALNSNISLSSLTVIFQDEPGLASFIEAKDDESGGDIWSYTLCKAPDKSSPPTNQHPTFYRPDALRVTQPTVSKH